MKRRLSRFDKLYFSPLFVKDNEAIKYINRKSHEALQRNIENAKKSRKGKQPFRL